MFIASRRIRWNRWIDTKLLNSIYTVSLSSANLVHAMCFEWAQKIVWNSSSSSHHLFIRKISLLTWEQYIVSRQINTELKWINRSNNYVVVSFFPSDSIRFLYLFFTIERAILTCVVLIRRRLIRQSIIMIIIIINQLRRLSLYLSLCFVCSNVSSADSKF